MTINIISQDEVDALLNGLADGAIGTEDTGDSRPFEVRPYDFIEYKSTVSNKMPGLEIINHNFSKLLRTSIYKFMLKYFDINIRKIETMTYSDFISTVTVPSSMNIFTMEPLIGDALLVLESPLVFAFVEGFFGGSAVHYIKSDGRAFTQIEQRVIRKVVDVILEDVESAWQVISPVKSKYVKSEINPPFVSIAAPEQSIINIEVQLVMEDFSGRMSLCIPDSMLEPVKEKLYSGIQSDRYESNLRWEHELTESLMNTDLHLSADLGKITMNFEDLLNLKEGSILNLSRSASDELVIKIEDSPKFKGIPGVCKGKHAVKLSGSIN
jgi:flagellar motor switch protein FliM